MTREEAIQILKDERWYMSRYSEEYKEAYDMAIEALKNEPILCKDCKHWQKTNIETIDGEPTYDCPFCGEWADANGFCSFGERADECE